MFLGAFTSVFYASLPKVLFSLQAIAATKDESRPPDRSKPKGTSDKRCRLTAVLNAFRNSIKSSLLEGMYDSSTNLKEQ